MSQSPDLVRLPEAGTFPKVELFAPGGQGFIVMAAVVDRRPRLLYFLESGRKKCLLRELKAAAVELARDSRVEEATVFKTLVVPPGRGSFLDRRPNLHIARYDVVVLIRTTKPDVVADVRALAATRSIKSALEAASGDVLDIDATMGRCIGPVDHGRDGVFLFNFFVADDCAQNLAVWEYTAG